MQFEDGNRIDLTLIPPKEWAAYFAEDKLTVVLLDKDGTLPQLPPPTDEDYRIKRPSQAAFTGCCNEFWWVSTYVAKGLWRGEILYAQEHLNSYVRKMLIRMLEWRAGIDTSFTISAGKCSKYLDRYIPETEWQRLLATFATGDRNDLWRAVFVAGELFRETARYVSSQLGYPYNEDEDTRVTRYLRSVEASTPK